MEKINLWIDGREISGKQGITILEAAKQSGIHIPTLCHSPELTPSGNCRVCVVEVKGAPRLVASCHTPIVEGMVILTDSASVLEARRAVVELLMTAHTGPCVIDAEAGSCELHKLAAEIEIGLPRFQVKKPRFYPVEEVSPYVRRDLSKCILCRRCIRACREIAKKDILAMAYRGFASKVVVDCDGPLNKSECRDCGGFVSEKSIVSMAQTLGISVSEVYGVVTFYAFLSVKPQGKHVVRACKSVPCHLKRSEMVAAWIGSQLEITPGRKTPDGRFTFELVNCIGACDKAPAMLIDDVVYGDLTQARVAEILKSFD